VKDFLFCPKLNNETQELILWYVAAPIFSLTQIIVYTEIYED